MKFEFFPMRLKYLKQIEKWRYDGVVKDISVDAYYKSFEETGEMKGPGGCEGFAVIFQGTLVGLFEYYFVNDIMSIGLALSPDMVGKGYGKDFVEQGVNFGIDEFNYKNEYVKLTVNIENKPGIRVYEKVGFKEVKIEDDELEMRLYL